jgi:hypothetical protein
MDDLAPKQQTPGEHGIQVQRIIIAREFGEDKLVVRCKYTLGHGRLGKRDRQFVVDVD